MTIYTEYHEEIRVARRSAPVNSFRAYTKGVAGFSLAAIILAGAICYVIGITPTVTIQVVAGLVGALGGALSARLSPYIFGH